MTRFLLRIGNRFMMTATVLIWSIVCTRSENSPWKTLSGHVPEAVSKLTPLADLPGTNQLHLAIGLPLRDPTGLQTFLGQLYDSRSTNYHHYLTPETFTARFGPTADDYAQVKAFAATNHFTITREHGNRLLLDIAGAAADIQNVFHIRLHTYQHPTEARRFFAPDTEPRLPVGPRHRRHQRIERLRPPPPDEPASPRYFPAWCTAERVRFGRNLSR